MPKQVRQIQEISNREISGDATNSDMIDHDENAHLMH